MSQDPDYSVEIETDHPEFRKLAFTSPGPKNAFAPLQRSGYGKQHQALGAGRGRVMEKREEATEAATTTVTESKSQFLCSFPATERSYLDTHTHTHTHTHCTNVQYCSNLPSAVEVKQEQPVSNPEENAQMSLPPPSVSITSSDMTSSGTTSLVVTSSGMTLSGMTSSVTVSCEGIKIEEGSMLEKHDLKVRAMFNLHCMESPLYFSTIPFLPVPFPPSLPSLLPPPSFPLPSPPLSPLPSLPPSLIPSLSLYDSSSRRH